jgi:heme exporter protein B
MSLADTVPATAPHRAPFGRQVAELVRRDLVVEARAREALLVTFPFGAAALLVVPLAVGTDLALLRQLGPGLYWTVLLLFGALVALRHSAEEAPAERDLLALLGVDPEARFVSRVASSTVLLGAFQLLLAPVAIVLYDPALTGWWWWVATVPLVAVGVGLVGTLATGLTRNLGERTSLASLLVVVLALPLLLAATQILESARFGVRPWAWLGLLMLVDLVLSIAGLLSARTLEEAPA